MKYFFVRIEISILDKFNCFNLVQWRKVCNCMEGGVGNNSEEQKKSFILADCIALTFMCMIEEKK